MCTRTSMNFRLKAHVQDQNKLPVLIFPEGTCINNTSVMMFKKGSFEVGGTIYPVAVKVNFSLFCAIGSIPQCEKNSTNHINALDIDELAIKLKMLGLFIQHVDSHTCLVITSHYIIYFMLNLLVFEYFHSLLK